ncbi:hypothetical protein [Mycoplasma seminis]|uniref:Uncharacterized protein n=1 Tax=Mycoplasma seminis TaxID=512749 RepID=A0ABY9HAR1_9MOLU|nr:hypothetical protein [Mycoplasma seminis]WLP85689.1 hypothetical protein Q8852_00830 [Mycoplasma seminis]
MSSTWLYIIIVALTCLLFYVMLKMYGYFNFVKAGFKLNWVQRQTYWKLGQSSVYTFVILLLFILYATGVLKVTYADKNGSMPLAFSAIGAAALVSYFAFLFYVVIIAFVIYVLIKNRNRIHISKEDYLNFDTESYQINIDKTYIKGKNNYTMFGDYITNSMMFKKYPKIFASKVIYYSLMFIYSSPVYDKVFESQVKIKDENNNDVNVDSSYTGSSPIAELFGDNKEYILYVLKTAYAKVNSIHNLDETIYLDAIEKACK